VAIPLLLFSLGIRRRVGAQLLAQLAGLPPEPGPDSEADDEDDRQQHHGEHEAEHQQDRADDDRNQLAHESGLFRSRHEN